MSNTGHKASEFLEQKCGKADILNLTNLISNCLAICYLDMRMIGKPLCTPLARLDEDCEPHEEGVRRSFPLS